VLIVFTSQECCVNLKVAILCRVRVCCMVSSLCSRALLS